MDLAYTFRGGLHLEEQKHTRNKRVETFSGGKFVRIPLEQRLNAPCRPLVSVGDSVAIGQKIGDTEAGVSCPVYASVSGTVTALEERTDLRGNPVLHVVIENDGQETVHPAIAPFEKSLADASAEEIISVIRQAGITGMDGTELPVYAHMEAAIGKVEKLIINGTESEPFLCAEHRLMLEYPAAVINGVKILLKALGVRTAWIAVENNKLDAINKLETLLAGSRMISVRVLKTRYPQENAHPLIYALTGQEFPANGTPEDVGCAVFQASACAAIFYAFAKGTPPVRRIVTVDGECIREAKNVLVPIGTPLSELIEFCGGMKRTPTRIVRGGPMKGLAVLETELPFVPVTAETSAVLCLSSDVQGEKEAVCIRCGRCVQHCPMHLMPNYIARFSEKQAYERARDWGALSCVECGLCSYVCPGRRENTQLIRRAAQEIRKTEEQK